MTCLVVAGLVFLAVLPLVRATRCGRCDAAAAPPWRSSSRSGCCCGCSCSPTEPALEDDQQRYLWEGGLVAHRHQPLRRLARRRQGAPTAAPRSGGSPRQQARCSSGSITRGLQDHLSAGCAWLRSRRPTGIAAVQPHRLAVWCCSARICATLRCCCRLLAITGRPPLWVALYWWNPIAIKEIVQLRPHGGRAHAAGHCWRCSSRLSGGGRSRHGMLGLAVGVKIWPLLLAPLLLRPLLGRPRHACRLPRAPGTALSRCGRRRSRSAGSTQLGLRRLRRALASQRRPAAGFARDRRPAAGRPRRMASSRRAAWRASLLALAAAWSRCRSACARPIDGPLDLTRSAPR